MDDRITPFTSLPKKHPWEKRVDIIRGQFPSVSRLDWYEMFRQDPDLAGRVIGDILKIGSSQSGKPGKRPALDPKDAQAQFRQLMGDDYSILPFTEAFKILCGNRSIRGIAAKTGLDRNMVHRLMKGADPTLEVMEAVAKAFKKDPSYFFEYRILYILGILSKKLESEPETTIGLYRKVKL